MFRFLHISIIPGFGVVDRPSIERRLSDLGRDWMFYNGFCWIIWTDKSVVTVSEMLNTHLHAADIMLVVAISGEEVPSGRLPQWAWDWFNRPRNQWTGDIRTPELPAPNAENIFAAAAARLNNQVGPRVPPPPPPLPKF